MADQFDPYYVWLGIPPKDQPPNHYRLLGLELYEENLDVIDAATNRQTSYLHEMSAGPNRKHSQELLNQIASARSCLLDPDRKGKYDVKLRKKLDEKPAAEKAEESSAATSATGSPTPTESAPPVGTDKAQTSSAAPHGQVDPASESASNELSAKKETPSTPDGGDTATETVAGASVTDTVSSATAQRKLGSSDRKSGDKAANDKRSGRKEDDAKKSTPESETADSDESEATKPGKKKATWALPAGVAIATILMAIVLMIVLNPGTADKPEDPSGTGPVTVGTDGNNPATDTDPDVPGEPPDPTPEMNVAGLVANWRFEDRDAKSAKDSTSGARDASFEGTPTFVDDGPYGAAVKLNGKTDRVNLPAPAFVPAEGTLAFWVRRDEESQADQALLDTTGGRFSVLVDKTGALAGGVGKDASVQTLSTQVGLEKSVWYHVALAWKSMGPATLFCNGERVGGIPSSGELAAVNAISIGYSHQHKSFAAVSVDDVRLFGRALGAGDLQKLLEQSQVEKKPPTQIPSKPPVPLPTADANGLLAHYEFRNAGALAKDARGSRDATNHGATVVTDPTRGGVLNLDGTDDHITIPRSMKDAFTVAFWLKTATPGLPGRTWLEGSRLLDGGVAANFGISLLGDRVAFGTGPPGSAVSTTIMTDDKWHFVLARRDGTGKLELFVDGRREAVIPGRKGPLPASPEGLVIGRSAADKSMFFKGQIDDLRLYEKVREVADVEEKLVERPTAPEPVPPRYALNTGNGADVEYWTGLAGEGLQPLLTAINDGVAPVAGKDRKRSSSQRLAMASGQGFGSNSGQRIRGYLLPPETGSYTFSTFFDDFGRLRVSSGASPDNLQEVTGKVHLTKGQAYFLEILHREASGTGTFSVGWILPDGTQESPIPAARLARSAHYRFFATLPVQKDNVHVPPENSFDVSEDGAVRIAGKRNGATYEITIPTDIEELTAFRIDALPDVERELLPEGADVMPSDGPGWGRSGKFSISEIRLSHTPPGATAEIPLPLQEAWADGGRSPGNAIDEKATSKWLVHDKAGQPCSLILVPGKPLKLRPDSTLKFVIVCDDNLGRFRIKATSAGGQQLERMLANFSQEPGATAASKPKNDFALHINCGPAVNDPVMQVQRKAIQPWGQGKQWGYVGGAVKAPADGSPTKEQILGVAVEGLTNFRVKVPEDGTYHVMFVFFDNWSKADNKRVFDVQIGNKTQVIKPSRTYPRNVAEARQLVEVIEAPVRDGLLTIKFKRRPGMQPPILNALSVWAK